MRRTVWREMAAVLLAACALALTAPRAAHAQADVPVNDRPNPYRTLDGWAKLPEGRTWGATSAVAIDRDGVSVWVGERCAANDCAGSMLDPILKFDTNGTLVKSFGRGLIAWPHGMTVDLRKNPFGDGPALVVADRGNRRIQYLALDGRHLGFLSDGIRMPCDMKVRGDRMLVPDLESVVTILGPGGTPVAQLCDGHPSSLRGAPRESFVPGKFVHPHDAVWLANGDILVAEWVPIGRITLLRATA